jgi:tRNA(Ile)-lysidine synthase TilS/MesJ
LGIRNLLEIQRNGIAKYQFLNKINWEIDIFNEKIKKIDFMC